MTYVCVARGLQRPPITGIRILVVSTCERVCAMISTGGTTCLPDTPRGVRTCTHVTVTSSNLNKRE